VSQQIRSDGWEVSGEADGYVQRFGYMHRRLCRRTGAHYEITDALHPQGTSSQAVVSFLVHPSLRMQQHGDTVTIARGDDALVQVTGLGGTWPEIMAPNPLNRATAFSEAYNELQSAPRIVFRPKIGWQSNTVRLTVLEPVAIAAMPVRAHRHAAPKPREEIATVESLTA
jgi:Heparinase II/III-like protein